MRKNSIKSSYSYSIVWAQYYFLGSEKRKACLHNDYACFLRIVRKTDGMAFYAFIDDVMTYAQCLEIKILESIDFEGYSFNEIVPPKTSNINAQFFIVEPVLCPNDNNYDNIHQVRRLLNDKLKQKKKKYKTLFRKR